MAQYKSVIINGKFLEQRITGEQRFALENVKEMDSLFEKEKIPCMLAVSKKVLDSALPDLKYIKIVRVGKLSGIPWEQIQLANFLRKNKALGLHLCNATSIFYPKGVSTVHDISYTAHPEFNEQKRPLVKYWHCIQDRVCSKKSNAVLTVSEFSKQEIVSTFHIPEEKVTVVYSGWQHFNPIIENDTFEKDFPFLKRKNYFYSMSTLKKNKNFHWVFENAKQNPNETYVIAGNFDSLRYGKDSANFSLPNIHYVGYVDDNAAKLLMKNCKAFLFPSFYEGFGLPPLEVLALDSEVICSNATCLPEIYGNTVHYIDPYNSNVDLNEILKTPTISPEEILKKYSWKNVAEKIFETVKKEFYR